MCEAPSYFGTYTNGGNSVPYSSVELFAMGMVAESAVAPVRVALDGAWSNQANGTFTATQWQTFTASQIMSAAGGKIPANAGGQRHFRVATVVLTPNTVLDAASLTELNATLVGFAADDVPSYGKFGNVVWLHNFYTATRGLGSVRAGGLLSEAR